MRISDWSSDVCSSDLGSSVRGRYDQTVNAESAYEILRRRVTEARGDDAAAAQREDDGGGFLGDLFGTNRKRGERLSTGQAVTREVTRSVTNRVAGQIAADIGRSIFGKTGGTIGRAIGRAPV